MERLSGLIGNRIKELRKERGLRQEDMEEFGLSYRYYQKIESGRANITLGTVEKVARALKIDVRELFTFPLSKSSEINELAASVAEIIRKDDRKAAKKLNVFIREILE